MSYINYSMSERAAAAYDNGLLPASKLAKNLGVTTAAVKAILKPAEWHHTSAKFNKTQFYAFGEEHADELACMSLRKMREFDAAAKAAKIPESFRAQVTWFEWGGSQKHPVATKYSAEADVTKKGECYTISITTAVPGLCGEKGCIFRKFEGTRGFEIRRM